MSRKDPEGEVPQVTPIEKQGYITQKRTYKVITPLYGGGEEPSKVDSITVVRASEIRGQLRFWWRATHGGAFDGNLEKMKQREEEIWGSSGEKGKPGPSPVSVFINPVNVKKGNIFQPIDRNEHKIQNIGHPSSTDGYVAFPMRDVANPAVWENVEFELKIRYPKEIGHDIRIEQDVQDAFWAWETFGGIGARTRRGFGALQLTHLAGVPVQASKLQDARQHILRKLKEFELDKRKWPKGIPHLTSNEQRYKLIQSTDSTAAWRYLTHKLRDFRQSFRHLDRNGRHFGRSKWPEPDQIRRETGTFTGKHTPSHPVQKFPRGKFGLPIIFEFKEGDVAAGDPDKTTLQGAKLGEKEYIDRLASPLLLRPVACSDGALSLALILEWEPINSDDEKYTPPGGLVLKGETKDFVVHTDLDATEASHIPPLNGQPDVLQAFLDFLK